MNTDKLLWKEIRIPNKKNLLLFCDHYFEDSSAPNILYIQTPIGSVTSLKRAYEPLAEHHFNVFAVDLSGIGNSEGNVSEFSLENMIDDLDSCVDYISEHYTGPIHLFGGTGTGGILGQYYAGYSRRIASFAQYGVGIYRDVSFFKQPLFIIKSVYFVLRKLAKIVPNISISMSPPKYNGFHKELDDSYYEMLLKENPKLLKLNVNLFVSLLEMFLDKNSALKDLPQCPTLVFETLYDRYFDIDYFRCYFNKLTCKKKLYTIEDVHNSYYFHSDEVCREVALWFQDNK